MIGKVCRTVMRYYDSATRTTKVKGRPVLIVGGPNNNDYTVLPLSTIAKRENQDPEYDILIGPEERDILHLVKECFIRTHKRLPVHSGSLGREYGDMKRDIPELYLEALVRMEQFQRKIVDDAL